MRHLLPGLRAGAAATVLAAAAVLAGCGDTPSPAEAVPELADRLERVDAAIADDQPARARKAVEALVDEATQARMSGEITADQADAILRAAAELLERLPTQRDGETTDPTDPASPEPPLDLPESDEGDEPKHEDEEDEDDEGHGKGRDGEDSGEGGGGGKGPPEGNGPDDGHGD